MLIVPYRHPLLIARMAANLNDLSGGRLVLGVGVGWAEQEFDALGVPFRQRGKLTDDYLRAVRAAWADEQDYRSGRIPIWVGGNSDAGLRRAVLLGEAWHPLRFTIPWLRKAMDQLTALADEQQRPVPAWSRASPCGWPNHRSPAPGGWPVTERSGRSSTIWPS